MKKTWKTVCLSSMLLIMLVTAFPVSAAAPATTATTGVSVAAAQDGVAKKVPCNPGKWQTPPYWPCQGYYYIYPTFYISGVQRNGSVTVTTFNLPPNDRFDVMMNVMGTLGLCGIVVASINTGSGGTQTLTFNIPPQLYGQFQIAIRMQSTTGSGYYAYNWFYNNSTY